MSDTNYAQPDVTLLLDGQGVIQKAALSNAAAGEGVEAWVGRAWASTVDAAGGASIARMVEDALESGVSGFHTVAQRFPSGREIELEFTTVRLGGKAGLLAIGRNLHAVAELRARLVAAQQSMEQDYWKLREVETRYRLLFDASSEPVLLVGADDLRILEANPAAIRAVGLARGLELLPEIAADERDMFRRMLLRVRDQGRAPGVVIHLGTERQSWMVRASRLAAEPGAAFLLQLARTQPSPEPPRRNDPLSVPDLFDRLPDGFAVIDREGVVLRANRAFLDLVQVAAEGAAVGESLGRWLVRPGAELGVLLGSLNRHGVVRLFATTLRGDLGEETEVEISAAGNTGPKPDYIGVLIRNVGRRLAAGASSENGAGASAPSGIADQIGQRSMRSLVRDAVSAVERQCIEAALRQVGGNRSAAAELLGLSRQSLYTKLSQYGLDDDG